MPTRPQATNETQTLPIVKTLSAQGFVWYGGEQEHNDDCDGDCYPCTSHEIGRVLDMHHEDEDKLQREGELILAKGATQ